MAETSSCAPAAQIPRTTCKLFGAIKALGTIQRSVVLVHGPKGCVYHINYILGMRGDRPSEIYTTALNEHDVIFGAEGKLSEAIRSLDRTLSPDLLFVLSCCSSEIIGEDVGSAVRDTRTRARTVPIAAGGFEGDLHAGYRETLCQLVREFAHKPSVPAPRSVNLVGMFRAGPDLAEMRSLLAMIGVSVSAVLTAGSWRADLERLGDAALNIVVCEPSGKDAAGLLKTLCGTPYIVEEIPTGYRSSLRFLERVADALGVPAPGSLPAGHANAPDCRFLASRRIALVSGPTRAISMVRFLAEYQVVPRLVIVDADPASGEKIRGMGIPTGEVLIGPGHELIVQKLREHDIDLLIGGMLELPLAKELSIDHIDIMHGSELTAGFSGAENLARLIRKKAPGLREKGEGR